MEGYSAKIVSASCELSAKEKVQLKDTSNAVKLDDATKTGDVHINLDMYATLEIHNENSENKDYEVYVIIDKDGTKYTTGSSNFFSTFKGIVEEMEDSDEEWGIVVYRKPSKNFTGRDFLTCSVE